MQVDYQNIDNLNARMTVSIAREDYEAKYKTAIHDYRKKGSFKGFRKGKTPVGYLEKLVGQDLLTKTVTDLLTDAVSKYLEEQHIPYIGQPLPATDQAPVVFDPKDLAETYSYTFDVGLLPDFEVKGLDEEMEWYDVAVTQDQIDKEWNDLLKRKGTYVHGDEIDGESRVNMRFREMEGLGAKIDGRESTKMIYPDFVNDEIKAELKGKHVGDIIRFNPDNFLRRGELQAFRRYYFDINDENEPLADMIEGQVLDITNLKPAEPNEEFFNSVFDPGAVTSEDEAREVIAKALKQRNDVQSDAHLRHMIEHRLMDSNQFDLPIAFIERLIHITQDDQKEKPSPEKQANAFRWHFIKDKLRGKFNIDVSQDEILHAAADMVYDRFGASLPYDRMREVIERYLADRDSVEHLRNTVADNKLFFALKELIPVVKKEISPEQFKEMQMAHRHEH